MSNPNSTPNPQQDPLSRAITGLQSIVGIHIFGPFDSSTILHGMNQPSGNHLTTTGNNALSSNNPTASSSSTSNHASSSSSSSSSSKSTPTTVNKLPATDITNTSASVRTLPKHSLIQSNFGPSSTNHPNTSRTTPKKTNTKNSNTGLTLSTRKNDRESKANPPSNQIIPLSFTYNTESIYFKSIDLLNDEHCLNDEILNCWMKYMYTRYTRGSEHRNRLILFPTTTYPYMMDQNSTTRKNAIQQLMSNNSHTQCIFDKNKKYAFVVMEGSNHWSLAVIINPNLIPARIQQFIDSSANTSTRSTIESKSSNTLDTTIGTEHITNISSSTTQTKPSFSAIDNEEENKIPLIVLLNSSTSLHDRATVTTKIGPHHDYQSVHDPRFVANTIRTYLAYAYVRQYQGTNVNNVNNIPVLTEDVVRYISVPVSQQTTYHDCGVFVLEYIRKIITNSRPVESRFPPLTVPNIMTNIHVANTAVTNNTTTVSVFDNISVQQDTISSVRIQITRILEAMGTDPPTLAILQHEHNIDNVDAGDQEEIKITSGMNPVSIITTPTSTTTVSNNNSPSTGIKQSKRKRSTNTFEDTKQ